MNLRTARELRDPTFTNANLRRYEARLLKQAAELRERAGKLEGDVEASLQALREGGDYMAAEAISLAISLAGIATFQWLAIVGGITALYASVQSRIRNDGDPIHRLVADTLAMRSVRRDAKALIRALRDVQAEKVSRAKSPLGWP